MERVLQGLIWLLLVSTSTTSHAGLSPGPSEAGSRHVADATQANTQQPVPPPRSNPQLKRILQAMDAASTEGHPDLFGQFAGMQRLFAGQYMGAMTYFELGARYADKLSQISIGMMYLHGRGVSKDEASACAWITLAAERGYPSYVSARDRICGALSPAQHVQAMTLLDRLWPEYGDLAAKQRMKLVLRTDRNSLTGSHLGHDAGVRSMASDTSHAPDCSSDGLVLDDVHVPIRGCGRYDPRLEDPKVYFAARDEQWQGVVTVGELLKVDPPILDDDKKASRDEE